VATTHTHGLWRPRPAAVSGIIIIAVGAIFEAFAIAPAVVPGGVPAGPLEFGGKIPNALELLLGALIIIIGSAIWKFGPRHNAILGTGVVFVFVLSVFAVLSSLNSNLTFTAITVDLQYGPSDQGFFGPTMQKVPITMSHQPRQNLSVDELSSFSITFPLQESSLAGRNDGIASIKATTAIPGFSFQIRSVVPPLPVVFSPGALVQFNLSLVAPGYSTGQSCPPQYCLHGKYIGPINLALTTTDD
jgi:hypothetical protein